MLKNKLSLIFLFSLIGFTSQVFAQSFNYLSPFNSQGVPLNVLLDTVNTQLIANISTSLPESYPVPTYHPEYLASGVSTEVELLDTASVWVTYVNEGAGYKNVLGFYTYTGSPSATAPSDAQVTIIFPNVSNTGSGGGLVQGNKMYLGSFPAGTKIGWVLIANGFNMATGLVTYGNWILYSNPDYNPESNPALRIHNVMLFDSATSKVVLGFEDIRRDNASCDQDFNDAIFYITASPDTAINTSSFNETTEGTPNVNSGNGGGLESDNRLASLIALRRFDRIKTEKIDYSQASDDRRWIASDAMNKNAENTELAQFFPDIPFEAAEAYTSTPTDLVTMTNAKEVMAMDYFQEGEIAAVMLATLTENEVYNHTKVICDRLGGASLENIKTIKVNGYDFILTQLQQKDGQREYATNFVVYEENGTFMLQTEWTIDQYPASNKFYNFQIWSKAPHLTQKMIEEVMLKLNEYKPLTLVSSQLQLPKVFVKKGAYKKGILTLDIVNPIAAQEITIKGVLSRSETAQMHEDWTYTFALNGAMTQSFSLPIGKLFDTGISVENDADNAIDVLYLADGPWGISENSSNDNVSIFEVSSNRDDYTTDAEMAVERNVSLKGQVNQGVSLFRMLRSNAAPVDVSAYNHLTFKGKMKGKATLTLVKSSITNWEEQFRMPLQLSENTEEYTLPLSLLTSKGNHGKDWSDISSIVINIEAGENGKQDFEFEIADIAFVSKEISPFDTDINNVLNTYPSPCTDVLNVKFICNKTEEGSLSLYDAMGKMVHYQANTLKFGTNENQIPVDKLAAGIYILKIRTATLTMQSKIVVQ